MIVNFTSATLPFRAEFNLASTHCLFATNSREALKAILAFRPPSEIPSALNTFRLEIIESDLCISESADCTHFRGLRHLVFAKFEPRSFVIFDLLRRRVNGVLSSTNARNPRFWNALFLPVTIGLLGTTLGVVPLHCACLDRNRSGLLVAGEAGAGKSTLTAALAKRGFGVVSDDWTYISKDGEDLSAHGLFAPVKLLPDTIRFFPELQNFALKRTLNGEMAHEIDPVSVFRSVTKAHSSPKWMLFLQRTVERGCRFGRCSPEYITNFFERNAEKLPPELQHASHARSEIIQSLSRCTSWILETGDGPIQTAAAIDEFLLEV